MSLVTLDLNTGSSYAANASSSLNEYTGAFNCFNNTMRIGKIMVAQNDSATGVCTADIGIIGTDGKIRMVHANLVGSMDGSYQTYYPNLHVLAGEGIVFKPRTGVIKMTSAANGCYSTSMGFATGQAVVSYGWRFWGFIYGISAVRPTTFDSILAIPAGTFPLTDGNLTIGAVGNWSNDPSGCLGTAIAGSGKRYFEVYIAYIPSYLSGLIGISRGMWPWPWNTDVARGLGVSASGTGAQSYYYGVTAASGSIIGIVTDCNTGTVTCYLGNSQIAQYAGISDLAYWVPYYEHMSSGGAEYVTFNFGATPFTYALPSGCIAWDRNSKIYSPLGGML